MILTIEHTAGGRQCNFCDNEQNMYSINIKTESFHSSVRRLRLCTPCSVRLKRDVNMAVKDE